MSAVILDIENLRRRRKMFDALEREKREKLFQRRRDFDPDGTPPGGHAA